METARSVRDAFDLMARVALVIGAGSDIGRTTSEVLAAAGATVMCADIDREAAATTARNIVGEGGAAESTNSTSQRVVRAARWSVTSRHAMARCT